MQFMIIVIIYEVINIYDFIFYYCYYYNELIYLIFFYIKLTINV